LSSLSTRNNSGDGDVGDVAGMMKDSFKVKGYVIEE
jgi:hypothetical protein